MVATVSTWHDSTKAFISWHFENRATAKLFTVGRELVALNEKLGPLRGNRRKPKTPPKPIDREWLKKRKKLLKALRK
jgi:hypothetical protein